MKDIANLFKPFSQIGKNTKILVSVFSVVILLFAWNVVSGDLFPSPMDVFTKMIDFAGSDSFWRHAIVSIGLTCKSMFYAIIISMFLACLWTLEAFKPLIEIIRKFRYLTINGVIFLFTVMFHNGSDIKMALLLFGIVPFFLDSLIIMINAIPQEEHDLCTVIKYNKFRTLYELLLLGRLDQVLIVMKQNFAISWMMITCVEGVCTSEGGLGFLLTQSAKYIHLNEVFAVLLFILLIGIFIDWLIGKIRTWLFPYTR